MKKQYSKGFTLIEIIIVIVIIGVLATLALPKITGMLEGSRSAEAMSMLGVMKRAADQCYDNQNGVLTGCTTRSSLGINTNTTGELFTYLSKATATNLQIQAKRNAGTSAGEIICMEFIPSSATTTTFGVSTPGSPYTNIITRAAGGAANVIASGTCAGWAAATIM